MRVSKSFLIKNPATVQAVKVIHFIPRPEKQLQLQRPSFADFLGFKTLILKKQLD